MKITCLLVLVLLCAVFTFFLNFTVLQLTEDDDSSKKRSLKRFIKNRSGHKIAGLSCERYGGPPDEIASEMVYWRDIKTDEEFRSPFASVGPNPKYLTFEPDEGNWNNKRLSMETAVVMAVFMGRTLVLPPQQELVYSELFHFAALAKELPVDIITMEEFLNREALTGNLRDEDGKSKFPPDINRTSWDGDMRPTWKHPLWPYLREVTRRVRWEKDTCIAAFPDNKAGPGGEERLRNYFKKVQGESMPLSNMKDPLRNLKGGPIEFARIESYTGNPTPVDAPPQDRMRELLSTRIKLCIYDEKMQNEKYLHTTGDNQSGTRLLAHFYSLLFFEDWHHDIWVKRFVRDHIRYVDGLQCAAARIVNELRQISRQNGNPEGDFDSFHIRRGDFLAFQQGSQVNADEIYKNSRSVLEEGSVVFIASDEKDKSFFSPLRKHYHLHFLDNFMHLIEGISPTKYGLLDQLVASRGRTFVGLYYSTFTGYINRMRAYHSQKDKSPGYEDGIIRSYFYAERRFKYAMRQYHSMSWPIWAREFPTAWRDIDHDVPANNLSSEVIA